MNYPAFMPDQKRLHRRGGTIAERHHNLRRELLHDHSIDVEPHENFLEDENHVLEIFDQWYRTRTGKNLTPGDVNTFVKLDLWTNADAYRFKQYRVTQDDWNKLGPNCQCCGQSELQAVLLELDYKQYRKQVVGKLCRRCKTLMGFARFDATILENAAKYIRDKDGTGPITESNNIASQADQSGD